ncbi:MAG: O-antigen ligase family protein [Candidatus Hodarchaeota archaeon]
MRIFHNRESLSAIPKRLVVFYVGLVSLMLLSLSFTPSLEYGLSKASEFTTITTLACFAPFFLFRSPKDVSAFLHTVIIMGIFLVAFMFLSRPYSHSIHFHTKLGSNYLAIQHISGMAGLIILYHFLMKKQNISQIIWWLLLLIALVCGIMYAGGKGPVLAFFLTVIFMAFVSIKFIAPFNIVLLNKRMLIFPFLVGIIGAFGLIFLTLTQDIGEKVRMELQKESSADLLRPMGGPALTWRIQNLLTSGHYSQVERLENAKIALRLFYNYPLLGVGIGGFSVYSFEIEGVERFKYPHNILLEVLSEMGLAGFSLFFLITFFAFRYLIRLNSLNLYREVYLPKVFLSFLIFTFLNALVSQNIANPTLFAFIGSSYAVEQSLKKYGGGN